MSFEVSTFILLKFFWDLIPCRLINVLCFALVTLTQQHSASSQKTQALNL